MRCALLTLLSLGLGAARTADAPDFPSKMGVAVKNASGVCFSIRNARLGVKEAVTLVAPLEPQSVIGAEVVAASSAGCPGVKDSAMSGYRLRITKGKAPDFMPLIAVVGSSAKFRTEHGVVSANLQGSGKPDFFRSCTATDGVHLTMWKGRPLEGVRVWHQYYYLGQDLEPNCSPKDTVE